MANFNIQITNRGRALQAKAQAGTPLVFTRMRLGSGTLSGQQIAELTGLIDPKLWLTINKSMPDEAGEHIVGAYLSNANITTGFYFREWGVFAQDPDLGEILYSYGNVGAGAEYISAGGGSDVVEKQLNAVAIIGNASNVSAVLDESLVFPSRREFDDHREAAVLDHPDGSVTTAKLANGAANDDKIGERTISDADAPSTNTAKLTSILSGIAHMIKAITGGASWRTLPTITLSTIKSILDAATNAATANTIIKRDANGRAKVAAPSTTDDIARKAEVDSAITTAASDATTKASAAQSAAITAAASDATSKANAVQSNLNTHTGDKTVHITSTERTAWNAKPDKNGTLQTNLNSEMWNGWKHFDSITSFGGAVTDTLQQLVDKMPSKSRYMSATSVVISFIPSQLVWCILEFVKYDAARAECSCIGFDANGKFRKFSAIVSNKTPHETTGWREESFLDSPAFTGTPTTPTPPIDANNLEVVNASFVARAVANTNTLANLDTRSTNELPNYYSTGANSRRVHNEFKFCTAIGLTGYSSTAHYCTLLTDVPWTSTSGGTVRQVALAPDGKVFIRISNSAHTAWEGWREQAYADSVDQVIGKSNAWKKSSDLPNTYPVGMTYFNASTTVVADQFNGQRYAYVLTIKPAVSSEGNLNFIQYVFPHGSSDGGTFYYRYAQVSTNSWSPFKEIADKNYVAGAIANEAVRSKAPSATAIDPNTTDIELVVTNHANAPISGSFWYVRTYFYASRFSSKSQFAIQYNGDSRIFTRNYYEGNWSAWKEFAPINSPKFTGTPTVPTAASGTKTEQAASTAFVDRDFVKQTIDMGLDLNAVITSGFYRLPGDPVNGPPAGAYGQMIVSRGRDTITQIVVQHSTGRMFVRAGNPTNIGGSGTWGPWKEVAYVEDINAKLPMKIFNSLTTPVGASSGDLWFPPPS